MHTIEFEGLIVAAWDFGLEYLLLFCFVFLHLVGMGGCLGGGYSPAESRNNITLLSTSCLVTGMDFASEWCHVFNPGDMLDMPSVAPNITYRLHTMYPCRRTRPADLGCVRLYIDPATPHSRR